MTTSDDSTTADGQFEPDITGAEVLSGKGTGRSSAASPGSSQRNHLGGTSASQASQPQRSKKSFIGRIVAVLVSGLALYVVLPSLARVASAWPRLTDLSPLWLIGSALSEVASFTCAFGLQRLILRTKGWFAVVTAGLAGNAVTDVLPGGDAAGAGVQFKMLAQAGIDPDTAGAGLGAASLLGIGGLLALPVFTLPAILGGARVSPGLVHAGLLGLVGFVLFSAGGITVLATDRPLAWFGRTAQWLWNRLPFRHTKTCNLDFRLLKQRDAIRTALGSDWKHAVLLIAGRLGFDYLCLIGALRATGSNASPSLVLLAYAATGVIALLPITPGGLGVVEASLSGLLVLAGVGVSSAYVATLAYRLASYWLPLLAGLIAYPMFRRRYGAVQLDGSGPSPQSRR